MTNKLLLLSCVLALLGAVGGCGTSVAKPEVQDEAVTQKPAQYPKVAAHTPDENLEALEALALFEVGDIVLDLPSEALQCYGVCAAWKDEAEAQRAEQNLRLEPLVALAEEVRDTAELKAASVEEAKSALEALEALRIVDIGELIVDVPGNDPLCYNLPCPGAQEVADRANARRSAEVVELAARAKSLE